LFGTIFLAVKILFEHFNAILNIPSNGIWKRKERREKWSMEKTKRREEKERKKEELPSSAF
jgi:hypothetical protein